MAPSDTTMTSPAARRIVPMSEWAPAQEAMYGGERAATATLASRRRNSVALLQGFGNPVQQQQQPRDRSMSLSLPWRQRPKSSLLHLDDETTKPPTTTSPTGPGLRLRRSKSHGFVSATMANAGASAGPASASALPQQYHRPGHAQQNPVRGIIRRASLSLRSGVKGFMHRRTSVSAVATSSSPQHHDDEESQQPQHHHFPTLSNAGHGHGAQPKTAHITWNRLRQAASFRHSRHLHTGYGDRALDLEPLESPTLPIPGSGEQPPIIPRSTGAAARQAAAIAYAELNNSGGVFPPGAPGAPVPKPNWLAPEGNGGLSDHESGIGIALMSSEMELFVPASDEVDSDVDVDVGSSGADGAVGAEGVVVPAISKVDFVARLPVELAIQVLALLDASVLAKAGCVSRRWHEVVRNQHIWRESFLREKTTTYATSGPVKPGTGLGVPPVRPTNDWREVYRAKEELDRRWKQGKARPVYLNGHSDSIYCLQFDESKIITGSRDKTIRIWDMHTFACKLVIGPPEVINDGSLSLLYDDDGAPVHYATLPDRTHATVAPQNQRARAHASVPALVSFPTHHKASILCLQYDDRILVTGSSDASCIVHSLGSGYRPIRRLRHHSAAVLDLVFDEKHIVTCSKDISICVWDRATGALLKQLRGHSGPVNAVQMRGNTIVSCSGDFRVKLWNIDTGKNIREFAGHTKGLACSQFSEDGRYVASAGNDKVIRVWDANTGECLREMKAHDNLVRSLHVDSVSGRLVSGSYDTDIKVWDMETGKALLDFPRWHNSWVLSAKSDYRRIVSTGQDPKILIMDFGHGVPGIDILESRPPPPLVLERDGAGGAVTPEQWEMEGGYI